ncbi:hypothetical protein [Propioniciclava flava]
MQARRLADTRVRVAATLGDPTAPERAETIAEEFARAGEYADAAYAFWLLEMLRTDDVDAVYALESATEAFTLAHLQEPRREVGGELVAVSKRLGRRRRGGEVGRRTERQRVATGCSASADPPQWWSPAGSTWHPQPCSATSPDATSC